MLSVSRYNTISSLFILVYLDLYMYISSRFMLLSSDSLMLLVWNRNAFDAGNNIVDQNTSSN